MMLNIPRVIVTGRKNEKDTIISDRPAQHVIQHESGFIISDVWATQEMPVNSFLSKVTGSNVLPTILPNGSLFRYVVIPPDSAVKRYFPDKPGQPHPLMHQTATLDYIILLSGQLFLIMEDVETLLNPGDVVIQCATNHAWSNRTEEPCIQLAILLDANISKEAP
jgi:quercetin dioxygenase-like cupin family protein